MVETVSDTGTDTSRPRLSDRKRDLSWAFWLLWVCASAIGYALVGIGFHFPGDFDASFLRIEWGATIFGIILGGITGLLVGLLQWLVLRCYFRRSIWWLWTSALGIGLLHGLGDGLSMARYRNEILLLSGAFVGLLQWFFLRLQLTHARWWIITTMISWYIAWQVAFAIVKATGLMDSVWTPSIGAQSHGLFGAIFGMIYGGIMGALLLQLGSPRSLQSS